MDDGGLMYWQQHGQNEQRLNELENDNEHSDTCTGGAWEREINKPKEHGPGSHTAYTDSKKATPF